MIVSEMVKRAELDAQTAASALDAEVTGGYACDLLSAVMANAKEGDVWVTWHTHQNIVAVALLVRISAIILVAGRQPDEETARKAEEEDLPILTSKLHAFEIIGKLHALGIVGGQ